MSNNLRLLMVIAPDQFRDEELNVPRQQFLDKGWAVDVVSTQVGLAKGMLGATETVTVTLNDITASDYDAIVVVGGMGSIGHLWENLTLQQHLQVFNQQGKTIAAICLSGVALANAGLLTGKQATVWDAPEARQAYINHQVHYTGEPVTIDGRIITANGPDAAKAFGDAIIQSVEALVAV